MSLLIYVEGFACQTSHILRTSDEVRKILLGCLKCKYENCIFISWRLYSITVFISIFICKDTFLRHTAHIAWCNQCNSNGIPAKTDSNLQNCVLLMQPQVFCASQKEAGWTALIHAQYLAKSHIKCIKNNARQYLGPYSHTDWELRWLNTEYSENFLESQRYITQIHSPVSKLWTYFRTSPKECTLNQYSFKSERTGNLSKVKGQSRLYRPYSQHFTFTHLIRWTNSIIPHNEITQSPALGTLTWWGWSPEKCCMLDVSSMFAKFTFSAHRGV